jgi:hypothetical protein
MVMIPGGPRAAADMEKGTPVPEGTYNLRIDKAEIKKAEGADKSPYINLMLTITDDGEYLGRKVFDICTLKKGADFKLRQLLTDGLGWADDQPLEDTDQLQGEEVVAAITIEKGRQGYEDRNKVQKYLPR